MPEPHSASDSPRQIGVFELARLLRTDSLADPVVRARSLCVEISRATDCQRVSLVAIDASGCHLIATSTTDTPDHRSEETLRLQSIAAHVQRTAKNVTHAEELATSDAVQWLALPVFVSQAPAACVVLQRYVVSRTSIEESVEPIVHSIQAAAADIVDSWQTRRPRRRRGPARYWERATRRQRIAIAAGSVALLSLLACLPIPFRLPVEGRLQPARSYHVYAPAAGVLTALHVQDGQTVRRGELLAEIQSVDVQLPFDRIHGELAAAETELATLRLNQSEGGSQNNSAGGGGDSRQGSSTRRMVLRARMESLTEQAALIDEVRRSLSLRAPIDGRVELNDAQSELAGQNVLQSQWIMQVVDPDAGYHAILDLPEQQYGYVHHRIGANPNGANDPHADMRLRSSPDLAFTGRVIAVADTVQWNERGLPAVPITVAITDPLTDNVHLGGSVIGSIDAGYRPLGFILFRPLIELLRSNGW